MRVDPRPAAWPGLIERYRDRLPVGPTTPVVTLLEGGTPLVPAPVLSARTGCDVWLKVEGANPTGSFKDRGMTVAVSRALEEGARAVLCASTGNTSASAAAYAARAAIPCAVVIPEGRIALGKLAQALVHGASVLAVDGSFDDCLVLVRELAERYPVALVNSVNPYRIEGQKTAAFEVCDFLGQAPDVLHASPGQLVTFTSYAANNGPSTSQLDAIVEGKVNLSVKRQRCQVPPVSPDGFFCEFGTFAPGKTSPIATICAASLG